MRILFILLLFVISAPAFAVQCINLSKDQALAAQLAIEHVSKKVPDFLVIDQYCEHCLDAYPRPIVVDEVTVTHDAKNYYLLINEEKVDIAYIYVDNKNLASLAGCKTIAVSKIIGL